MALTYGVHSHLTPRIFTLKTKCCCLKSLPIPRSENLCLKFFKQLIGVHRNTTSIAVLSELGRFPCQIICIINIIKYWHRISVMDKDSLLYKTYKSQLEIIEGNNDGHHLWLHFVREILKLCKLEIVFYNPTNLHTYRIINRIRDVLKK